MPGHRKREDLDSFRCCGRGGVGWCGVGKHVVGQGGVGQVGADDAIISVGVDAAIITINSLEQTGPTLDRHTSQQGSCEPQQAMLAASARSRRTHSRPLPRPLRMLFCRALSPPHAIAASATEHLTAENCPFPFLPFSSACTFFPSGYWLCPFGRCRCTFSRPAPSKST